MSMARRCFGSVFFTLLAFRSIFNMKIVVMSDDMLSHVKHMIGLDLR